MSDLTSYVNHCYDLLLKSEAAAKVEDDAELCACATLVERGEE